MGFLSKKTWDRYKSIINSVHDDFNQAAIVWKKSIGGIDRFGEDNKTERFQLITLKCLVNYNDKRIWPATNYTETGELDKESEVILFNLNYLKQCGYLNSNGNFIFEPSTDRMIHQGVLWKCSGITNLSQASDIPLLCQLIMQKEVVQSDKPTN